MKHQRLACGVSRGSGLICLAFFATIASAGSALDRIKSSGKIVVAYQPGAPFAYTDGTTPQPVGYSIDLCQKFAEAIRKSLDLKTLRIDYLPVTSADRIPTITSGRADIECASSTNNKQRRELVAFSIPHFITGTRYAVLADSQIDAVQDFYGKKVVSVTGSTALASIARANKERMLGMTVVAVRTADDALLMVERREVDGFAMDDVLLFAMISDRLDPKAFKVVGKFLTIEPLAMILPKDDREMKQIVDTEMKRLIFDGEAYKLYQHWFEQPIPPKGRSMSMPMSYLLRDFWRFPSDSVPD